MFAIVITDKGGEQRRMEFDRNEITIGRVQGNDIILPKGNVSKRHSRIVLKDNRFIVVDLKSTNGTYVNGRKITSPLVVRPGDKVYIGDFILVLEEQGGNGAAKEPSAAARSASMPPPSASIPPPTAAEGAGPSRAPARLTNPPPLPAAGRDSVAPARASESAGLDLEEPSASEDLGDVPPLPGRRRAAPTIESPTMAEEIANRARQQESSAKTQAIETDVLPPAPGRPADSLPPPPPPPELGRADTGFHFLMYRLAGSVDLSHLSGETMREPEQRARLHSLIQSTIEEMKTEGVITQSVETQPLAELALREAAGLGALEPLMNDKRVREIIIEGPGRIVADYGDGLIDVEGRFSSASALMTIANRLLAQGGEKLSSERLVHETTLPNGVHILVVQPPLAVHGPVIEIRRKVPSMTGEQLVSAGFLNDEMFELLKRAVEHRRNVLVLGEVGAGVTTVLASLAAMCEQNDRIVTVEDVADLFIDRKHVIALASGGVGPTPLSMREVLKQAGRLRSDRLIVDDVRGAEAYDVLTAMAARRSGNFFGFHTLFNANPISSIRLLALLQKGVDENALIELISRVVHLVVQVARTDDGRKVVAISELLGVKSGKIQVQKLFVYEGEFKSTGHAPRFDAKE